MVHIADAESAGGCVRDLAVSNRPRRSVTYWCVEIVPRTAVGIRRGVSAKGQNGHASVPHSPGYPFATERLAR